MLNSSEKAKIKRLEASGKPDAEEKINEIRAQAGERFAYGYGYRIGESRKVRLKAGPLVTATLLAAVIDDDGQCKLRFKSESGEDLMFELF